MERHLGALLLTWAQFSAAEQEQGPTGPKATLELKSCFHRSLGIFWALNVTTQVWGEPLATAGASMSHCQ